MLSDFLYFSQKTAPNRMQLLNQKIINLLMNNTLATFSNDIEITPSLQELLTEKVVRLVKHALT